MVVENESAAADIVKSSVASEEAIVKVAKDEADEIETTCNIALEKALPILKAAERALEVID